MPVPESQPPYSAAVPTAYFFIDQNGFTQSTNQSFGPVLNNEVNEFRVTSKFSCTTARLAYAICKGVVLVQPQTGNSNRVNLILRPYKQPFPGLNISYFVYRGLRKADFFSTNTIPEVIPAISTASDLVKKINADFDAFYSEDLFDENGTLMPKPAFEAKYIGYDPSIPSATFISDLFFKNSEFIASGSGTEETHAYELPLIDGGKSLGSFEGTDCGMDVVLNYGDYRFDFDNSEFIFDLAYARAAEVKIVLTGSDLEKKIQKEQIFQFVDVVAFFGLYTNNGTVKAFSSTIESEKTGIAIYTDLIAGFATKNNWYIYIQGDRARSYNYYGQYRIGVTNPNSLKFGYLESSLTEIQYGANGWPIIITTQLQGVSDGTNRLFIQLVTDNNNNVVLYGQIGQYINSSKDNFYSPDSLIIPPNPLGGTSRLTSSIEMSIPATPDGNNVSSFHIMLYQGIVYEYKIGELADENGQLSIIKREANLIDDIFCLIKAVPLIKGGSNEDILVIASKKLALKNQFYNGQQQGISLIKTLVVKDTIATEDPNSPYFNIVAYLTETVHSLRNALYITGASTSPGKEESFSNKSITGEKTYELPSPYYHETVSFTDSGLTINGVMLRSVDNTIPDKLIVGFSNQENDIVESLIGSNHKNPRLVFASLFEITEDIYSVENIKYRKYSVGILSESNGILESYFPVTPVILFTLDQKIFFSAEYSKYIKDKKSVLVELSPNF